MKKTYPADSLPVLSKTQNDTQKSNCTPSISRPEQQILEEFAEVFLTKFIQIVQDRTQFFLDDQEMQRQEFIGSQSSLARPGGFPSFTGTPACSEDESDKQEGE